MWLASDRDAALALLDLEADACSGCGQPRSESTLIENEWAYTAEGQKCHGCTAVDRAQSKFAEAGVTAGLSFLVHRDRPESS